jgi:hypothetical protein
MLLCCGARVRSWPQPAVRGIAVRCLQLRQKRTVGGLGEDRKTFARFEVFGFNELGVSTPMRSSADCITVMSKFECSVHRVEIIAEANEATAQMAADEMAVIARNPPNL